MRRITPLLVAVLVLTTGGCLQGVGIQDETGPVDGTDGNGGTPPTDATRLGGPLTVHYLDVGQADATVVEFPNGETMLVDSGDWRQDGAGVIAALDALDVERLDHLVATHPHADHIGGHEAVIDRFETEGDGVGAAYDSGVAHTSGTFEEYLDAVERHDVDLYTVRAGDGLTVGNASVRFVNPPARTDADELHPNSVSLVVTYGETEFLFTGDLERPDERRIAENESASVDADVYQAGHHGSRTSSSPAFLDAVDPSVVVISSALDSQYDHPHNETLAAFADRDYETYWTAVHGDVTVKTDGSSIAVEPERDGPTDPGALRRATAGTESASRLDPVDFVAGASTETP